MTADTVFTPDEWHALVAGALADSELTPAQIETVCNVMADAELRGLLPDLVGVMDSLRGIVASVQSLTI